jgi:mannose-6-phosphate isomerase-like protein (cupin superfamily)
MIRLLADSSSTDGKLSTQHHSRSAELFYVLQGAVQLLVGERVVIANAGGLAVIPRGLPHAFAAAPGHDADLLIVLAPGVERFEYGRACDRAVLHTDIAKEVAAA